MNKDEQMEEISYENIKMREHIARLNEECGSWRRVAERLEGEKRDIFAKLEQAEKALDRIEGYWEANITVKTYARDALAAIRS